MTLKEIIAKLQAAIDNDGVNGDLQVRQLHCGPPPYDFEVVEIEGQIWVRRLRLNQ